ncbi:unnamed protein product [Peronospora farinosa]|uniref:Uncharacterized protein n=1 Tax=Peronospora farinosa TaxID=134698 RepID=A0AAV0UCN2_9STRA|nr:unnamed protein product [Peronospora farinosa]
MIDAHMTSNEFYHAIKHTARRRSPGPMACRLKNYQLFPRQHLTKFFYTEVFKANFRHWVRTLFKRTMVQIVINNSRSDFFVWELGFGKVILPLSPGLFVLFVEPLLCYIRAVNDGFAIKLRDVTPSA